MACPGLPGEQLLYLQSELISRAQGLDEEIIRFNQRLMKKSFQLMKSDLSIDELRQKLNQLALTELKSLPEEKKQEAGINEKTIQMQIKQFATPWFRFFLTYDPRKDLSRVKVPVLALFGEKDLQVPPEQNAPEVEKALRSAGNSRVTIKIVPGVNHLFQPASTGAPTEYAKIETTISPDVLNIIGDWVDEIINKNNTK